MLISACRVDAVAAAGRSRLDLPSGAVVTPLARERAVELGVELVVGGTAGSEACEPADDEVRRLVRAVLERLGEDPERERAVTEAVRRRLARGCGCRGR